MPYDEIYRPQFHFTARKNWLNDPNGLMFYKGEYHLFFQHNPSGNSMGNMTWGHAISNDLVHWVQVENAIEPDELGTIFSGSGVVDWENTAGFQTGQEKVLVCIYTSAGGTSEASRGKPFTQSIAYSNDCGRRWKKYKDNPVINHIVGENRDPRVTRFKDKWIMALYLDGNSYMLLESPNLKNWKGLSIVHLAGASECPDIFELPVDGDPDNTKWVFWGANGNYMVGSFDGVRFKPEGPVQRSDWGANFYAAQTWSDIPAQDGRKIQIAWMAGGHYPGMPFNQQMTFPAELSLRSTPDGIKLFRKPVGEISLIYKDTHSWQEKPLKPRPLVISDLESELLEIQMEVLLQKASQIALTIRGAEIIYDLNKNELSCLGRSAPLTPIEQKIKLQILVDRTSIEIFANDGIVSSSSCFLPKPDDKGIRIDSQGEACITFMQVNELKSIWQS